MQRPRPRPPVCWPRLRMRYLRPLRRCSRPTVRSESLLADFVAVIPQTHSLVLISYRPQYRGALSRVPGAQSIALAPLSDSETAALVTELLGSDSSVGGLATMIVERAAGNPFFVEEMVRELAERGVLRGNRSAYVSTA